MPPFMETEYPLPFKRNPAILPSRPAGYGPNSSSWSPASSFTVGCLFVVRNIVFYAVGYVARVELHTAGQNAV
jgi:hypothetical protein